MKPGWLLDIDGVINACGVTDFKARWPEEEWMITRLGPDGPDGQTYPFRVAPSVRDFIGEMFASGVDIRWHTTWQEGAEVAAEYLGLPTFPVLPAPEFRDYRYRSGSGPGGWWKLPSAARLFAEEPERPWIWTDDDIVFYVPAYLDLLKTACIINDDRISSAITCSNRLFISPDEKYGLSPTHLSVIRGFVLSNL